MERNTTLSTVLQVLTLLVSLVVSLVSAIGVLIVDSKVDQLTGQVRSLQELLVAHVTSRGLHSD